MASFDCHSFCARCRDKGKGQDPWVEKKDSTDCKLCISLIPEQHAQLATPSYKVKKEKREAKKMEALATPSRDSDLVDPSTVSVIGIVCDQGTVQSPVDTPEKKIKKDEASTFKGKKPVESKSTTDSKIAELDSGLTDLIALKLFSWPRLFNQPSLHLSR